MRKLLNTTPDFTVTILRVVLGVVFFAHGAQKVLGWWGGHGFHAAMESFMHMRIPAALAVVAIAAEFLGGLCLILGLMSRIAALGIIIDMAVAVWMVHKQFGFFMNWMGTQKGEGFEYHLLAIAMGLAILIKGGGAFSMDRLFSKSSKN
jgi:putative oxidoreductase